MEIAFLDAMEQRQKFRDGELSPSDVLRAQLKRIERHNGGASGINALTEYFPEQAMEQARLADDLYAQARRSTVDLPPLLGITVATKEKHALAGQSITQGLQCQRDAVAVEDHPIVERLKKAGAIIHARTTSPEFSCATVTHSPMWGVTRNPWNLTKSPGGSSGGAGAALAAGYTTLATASDIAGSTRIPAAFTGTVGYKAPYGRVPGAGFLASDWYRGDGPMGRTVSDVSMMSSVISGRHVSDANSWGSNGVAPLPQLIPEIRTIRFGVSQTLGAFPVSPSVADAFQRTVSMLRETGASVVEVDLPWTTEQVRETFFAHFGQILGPAMAQIVEGTTDERAPYTDRFIEEALLAGEKYQLIDSLRMDSQLNNELNAATAMVDVLLCPTNAVDWLEAEGQYLNGVTVAGQTLEHYWEGHMTSPFNIANRRPAISIPVGVGDEGVPIGLQIVGAPYDERSVFTAAFHLERLISFDAQERDGMSLSLTSRS